MPEYSENDKPTFRSYLGSSIVYLSIVLEAMMPTKKQRKKSEPKKLEFEAGKVFSPGEAKNEDFELDLASARYKAQKGEGGDRRT